jgi:hypothetical protein
MQAEDAVRCAVLNGRTWRRSSRVGERERGSERKAFGGVTVLLYNGVADTCVALVKLPIRPSDLSFLLPGGTVSGGNRGAQHRMLIRSHDSSGPHETEITTSSLGFTYLHQGIDPYLPSLYALLPPKTPY